MPGPAAAARCGGIPVRGSGGGENGSHQGYCQGLDSTNKVTSPTFALIHEYRGRYPLYHMDVYRLDDPAEILELGFDEYAGGSGIVVIEWGDRLRSLLPAGHIEIEITRGCGPEDTRQVRIRGGADQRLLEELSQKCAFSD